MGSGDSKANQEIFNSKFKAFEPLFIDGKLTDLKIIVEDETFKLHKFVLGAQSETLAEMFETNEDVKELNLSNINKQTFKIIVNFMYKDERPADDVDFLELYAASEKLKISELTKLATAKLVTKINADNALDVMNVANTYNSQVLKEKAFSVIKTMFPDMKRDEELMNRPDIVKELTDAKKAYEEKLKSILSKLEPAEVNPSEV
jgi:hypothetical protein